VKVDILGLHFCYLPIIAGEGLLHQILYMFIVNHALEHNLLHPQGVGGLRENNQFVTGIGAADVDFGTPHHDAVLVFIHYFQREMGILPFQGFLVAPPAWFGQYASHGKILTLHYLEIFHKPGMILGSQFLIHLPGRAVQSMKRIIFH